jgi:hypothetical protein
LPIAGKPLPTYVAVPPPTPLGAKPPRASSTPPVAWALSQPPSPEPPFAHGHVAALPKQNGAPPGPTLPSGWMFCAQMSPSGLLRPSSQTSAP